MPKLKSDTMQMSEARLNDLVYLTLKTIFFGSQGMSPRECDIRVCMQMAVPELRTGFADAILRPDETAGKSHDKIVTVCHGLVFYHCLAYLEDHWMKQTFETASGNPSVKQEMWDWLNQSSGVFEVNEQMPEEECAKTIAHPEPTTN